MIYAIFTVCALLLILFAVDIVVCIRDRNRPDKGLIHVPASLTYVSWIAGAVFMTLAVYTALTDEAAWVPLTFLAFALLGGVICMIHLNCRITYDEESFTHKNFIGVKRTYTYDQITGIRDRSALSDELLYLERRRVAVDAYTVGGIDFMHTVHKRYRALHGGRDIPVVKPKHGDLFNGHVEGAGGLLFVYILVGVICLGLLGFSVFYTWFMPPTPEECEKLEVVFDRWDGRGKTMRLYSADGTLYEISRLDEPVDADDIGIICDGQTSVTVYAVYSTPEDEDPYYTVKAIEVGDTCLLSFEDAARLHTREALPLVVMAGIFTLLWAVFIFFSIRVGRNPERYSQKVIRLFFKDGYVH